MSFDPGGRRDGEPMEGSLAQTHRSLRAWFEDWVRGVKLWDVMFEDDVAGAMYGKNPFTREPIRIPKLRLRRVTKSNGGTGP